MKHPSSLMLSGMGWNHQSLHAHGSKYFLETILDIVSPCFTHSQIHWNQHPTLSALIHVNPLYRQSREAEWPFQKPKALRSGLFTDKVNEWWAMLQIWGISKQMVYQMLILNEKMMINPWESGLSHSLTNPSGRFIIGFGEVPSFWQSHECSQTIDPTF